MQFHGTITLADTLAAHSLDKRLPLRAVAARLAVLFGVGAVIVDFIGVDRWRQILTVYVVLLLIYATLRFVVVPRVLQLRYRQNKAIAEPQTVEVTEDGVSFRFMTSGHWMAPWSYIFQWKADEDRLLLYTGLTHYYLIPASFCPDQASFKELVRLVESRLGKRAT